MNDILKTKKDNQAILANSAVIEMGVFFLFVILWWSNLKQAFLLFNPINH